MAGCSTETDPSDDSGPSGSSGDQAPEQRRRWQAHHDMTASEYQDRFDEYVGDEGLRLLDVSGYGVGGDERYAALWADVAGPRWVAHHGLSRSQFESKFDAHTGNGYRPTTLSAYTVDGRPRFAAIFEQYGGLAWYLYYGMSFSEYQSRFEEMNGNGFRPTDVTGYTVNGSARYGAIWQQYAGPAWHSHHGLSGSKYQDRFDQYLNDDFRVTAVGGFGVGGEARYVGTWQQFGGPAWRAHHGLTGSEYQSEFDDYLDRGFRLTDVSGYGVDGEARYAGTWQREQRRQTGFGGVDDAVASYMRDNRVPGLSLAVAKDERLVLAKGYGYANKEAGELMGPDHRLRVASISKPITGVAVLRLLEDGQLALDDEVFGAGGILGTKYGTPTHGYASGGGSTTSITVHHLLQHASGWRNQYDRDGDGSREGFDPMFEHEGKDHDALVDWVVSNMPLQYEPGTASTYLNFGYCLLGRVVEAVSGKDYEQYVRDAVLSPVGADGMAIAGDTRSEREPDEVAYYDGGAYGMPVARMDAHGGWMGTPTDLLRLTVRVDGFPEKADILASGTLDELADDDSHNSGYGEGWLLRSGWRGHNGCFSGAIGFLVRRDDGVSYAVLTNSRPGGDSCAWNLRGRIDSALNAVGSWPSHDLF